MLYNSFGPLLRQIYFFLVTYQKFAKGFLLITKLSWFKVWARSKNGPILLILNMSNYLYKLIALVEYVDMSVILDVAT